MEACLLFKVLSTVFRKACFGNQKAQGVTKMISIKKLLRFRRIGYVDIIGEAALVKDDSWMRNLQFHWTNIVLKKVSSKVY